MIIVIILIFVFTYLMYSVFATIMIRTFSIGIFKKGSVKNAISITFDDGPHPLYTPILLDLLKKFNVHATFFLVGELAQQHPAIVRRMSEEGHLIGVHHHRHVSNLLLTPWQQKYQLETSKRTIENIIEKKVFYYRPPWGHFNIVSLFIQKNYRTIMWSNILGDWKISLGVDPLFQRLMSVDENGGIVVLHDNGDTPGADSQAPAMTIAALEKFLTEKHSVRWLTVEEMIVETKR